jgi:hypothetical protein
MGAWAEESFGNDDAADWVAELLKNGSVAFVRRTLTIASDVPDDGCLSGYDGAAAVAAAEVVAAAAGRPCASTPFSEDALAWAAAHPEAGDLVALALPALDGVVSKNSMLWEAWVGELYDEDEEPDEDEPNEWIDCVDELRARLSGPYTRR